MGDVIHNKVLQLNKENSNLVNLFLNKDSSIIDKIATLCANTYGDIDLSQHNIILQIIDIDSSVLFSVSVTDSKFNYNLLLNLNDNKPICKFSIIKAEVITIKRNGNICLKSFKLISNPQLLIHKDTVYHPNFTENLNFKNNNLKDIKFEQLLCTLRNSKESLYMNNEYKICKHLIMSYNQLNQILDEKKQSSHQCFMYVDYDLLNDKLTKFIESSSSSSSSSPSQSSKVKLISMYLFSFLNRVIFHVSVDMVKIYTNVLSLIGNLETAKSIHNCYKRFCVKSKYFSIIEDIQTKFDDDVFYAIEINYKKEFQYQSHQQYIQHYIDNGGNMDLGVPEFTNNKLVTVYNEKVYQYKFFFKPELHCNEKLFTSNTIVNPKKSKYETIELLDNPYYKKIPNGVLSINPTLELFKKCFSIFSNGLFDQNFNWGDSNDNNEAKVVVSGGSVLASLEYLPVEIKREYVRLLQIKRLLYKSRMPIILVDDFMKLLEDVSMFKELLFKRFHGIKSPYFDSDIDLWIVTDSIEKGKEKIKQVANQLLENLKKKPDFNQDDYTFVRTPNSVTLVSKYPYRQIQIVITLYRSIEEIITFFDFDCVAAVYDGSNVYVLPKTIDSLNTRTNFISNKLSTTRIAKYCMRGFKSIAYQFEVKNVEITPKQGERHYGAESVSNGDREKYENKIDFDKILLLVNTDNENTFSDHIYGLSRLVTQNSDSMDEFKSYIKLLSEYGPTIDFQTNTLVKLNAIAKPRHNTHIIAISLDSNFLIETNIAQLKKLKGQDSLDDTEYISRFKEYEYKDISFKFPTLSPFQFGVHLTMNCSICDENKIIVGSPSEYFDGSCIDYCNKENSDLYNTEFRKVINQLNVLIIGGRTGFGFEISSKLLNYGFNVTCTSRYPELTRQKFVNKFKNTRYHSNLSRLSIIKVEFDINSTDSIQNFINHIKSTIYRIDILINSIHIKNNQSQQQQQQHDYISIHNENNRLNNNFKNNQTDNKFYKIKIIDLQPTNQQQQQQYKISNLDKNIIKFLNSTVPNEIIQQLSNTLMMLEPSITDRDFTGGEDNKLMFQFAKEEYIQNEIKHGNQYGSCSYLTGTHIVFDINGNWKSDNYDDPKTTTVQNKKKPSLKLSNIQTTPTNPILKGITEISKEYIPNHLISLSPTLKDIKKYKLFHSNNASNNIQIKRVANLIMAKSKVENIDVATRICNQMFDLFFCKTNFNVKKIKLY